MDDLSQWSISLVIKISIATFLGWFKNPVQTLKMDLSPKVKR